MQSDQVRELKQLQENRGDSLSPPKGNAAQDKSSKGRTVLRVLHKGEDAAEDRLSGSNEVQRQKTAARDETRFFCSSNAGVMKNSVNA